MFNEIDALKSLKESFKAESDDILLGIGDDCAALRTGENKLLLISTDSVVEDVHFSTTYFEVQEIARKSVAVSISDIASMGGNPRFILSTIGIPKCTKQNLMDELLEGIKTSCAYYGIELIGGNITASEKLFLDITAIGEIDEDKIIKRSGANPGDSVFVTGSIGDSALGLKLLNSGMKDSNVTHRHKNPEARTELGKELSGLGLATSMIDISDGLLLDLERITAEQNLGARIYLERIPLSDGYLKLVKNFEKDIYKLALTGGEDYELLFTSPPTNRDKLKALENSLKLKITEIGVVSEGNKVELFDSEGNTLNYAKRGFVHLN